MREGESGLSEKAETYKKALTSMGLGDAPDMWKELIKAGAEIVEKGGKFHWKFEASNNRDQEKEVSFLVPVKKCLFPDEKRIINNNLDNCFVEASLVACCQMTKVFFPFSEDWSSRSKTVHRKIFVVTPGDAVVILSEAVRAAKKVIAKEQNFIREVGKVLPGIVLPGK